MGADRCHSQFRQPVSRRGDRLALDEVSYDVPARTRFQQRKYLRWKRWGQRNRFPARGRSPRLALVTVLLWFCLVFQISCRSREASWDRLYSDARLELERGDGASAFTKAERGLRESAHSSENSDLWHWKFLVLKAETLLWRPDNSEVVRLLTPLPPPDLLGGELLVRAKAIKGMALAYLREDDFEAEKLLSEAVAQAAKVAPYLQCEGVLYEGNLAWRRMELPLAEQLFRKSLQLATDFKQSFIEAGALNQLGIILITTGRYDEGIEQSFKSLDLSRSAQYSVAHVAQRFKIDRRVG